MFRLKRSSVWMAALAVAAVLGMPPPPAVAEFKLRLSSAGVEAKEFTDADGDGIISYAGEYGNFEVVFTIGASKPAIGNDHLAQMDLTAFTVNAKQTVGGTLFIDLTDTGFNVVPGTNDQVLLTSSIGGNVSAGGTVFFQSWADLGNQEYGGLAASPGPTFTTDSQGPLVGLGFSSVAETSFTLSGGGPFSLTSRTTVTLNAGGTFASTDGSTTVHTPAPGALVLALGGLPLLGVYWMRRKRQ
ncbi:MAG: hypothetical protein L0Z62_20015 [Gemmataceae bacterium]|nr:hypothetical protein [Gemmataceae bacterium]